MKTDKSKKITIKEIEDLPAFITPKELNQKLLQISELKLYQLLGREGCPKIMNGVSILLPTRKFIGWLENQTV